LLKKISTSPGLQAKDFVIQEKMHVELRAMNNFTRVALHVMKIMIYHAKLYAEIKHCCAMIHAIKVAEVNVKKQNCRAMLLQKIVLHAMNNMQHAILNVINSIHHVYVDMH
jgi:hypothetical protein